MINKGPSLQLRTTETAIKLIKDNFERLLAGALNLQRVSAPLIVTSASGLNDNLNGVERIVSFDVLNNPGVECEVVQSLAKWKRYALSYYGFKVDEGLYTDMNAIRRDDKLDRLHIVQSYHIHTSILLFKANKFSIVFYNDEYDIKHSYNNQNKTYVIA